MENFNPEYDNSDDERAEGIRALRHYNQVLLQQVSETSPNLEARNKYILLTPDGYPLLKMIEVPGSGCQKCLCESHAFDMKVLSLDDTEVSQLYRPFMCTPRCCPCGRKEIIVATEPGALAGFVERKNFFCRPRFIVYDQHGYLAYKIKGPCCFDISKCAEGSFKIATNAKKNVGSIERIGLGQSPGFNKYSKFDPYKINFPQNCAVELKLTLVSAVILMDYMYRKRKTPNEKQ